MTTTPASENWLTQLNTLANQILSGIPQDLLKAHREPDGDEGKGGQGDGDGDEDDAEPNEGGEGGDGDQGGDGGEGGGGDAGGGDDGEPPAGGRDLMKALNAADLPLLVDDQGNKYTDLTPILIHTGQQLQAIGGEVVGLRQELKKAVGHNKGLRKRNRELERQNALLASTLATLTDEGGPLAKALQVGDEAAAELVRRAPPGVHPRSRAAGGEGNSTPLVGAEKEQLLNKALRAQITNKINLDQYNRFRREGVFSTDPAENQQLLKAVSEIK